MILFVDSVTCLIEKDGEQSLVVAERKPIEGGREELKFPPELYEGDGFTLLALEPDYVPKVSTN